MKRGRERGGGENIVLLMSQASWLCSLFTPRLKDNSSQVWWTGLQFIWSFLERMGFEVQVSSTFEVYNSKGDFFARFLTSREIQGLTGTSGIRKSIGKAKRDHHPHL